MLERKALSRFNKVTNGDRKTSPRPSHAAPFIALKHPNWMRIRRDEVCRNILFDEELQRPLETAVIKIAVHGLKGLTKIRLHLAIYFLAFPGRSVQKAARREFCRIIRHFGSGIITALETATNKQTGPPVNPPKTPKTPLGRVFTLRPFPRPPKTPKTGSG
jgi:hypothetical protein